MDTTEKCADCGSANVVTPYQPRHVICRDCHSISHNGEVVGRSAFAPRVITKGRAVGPSISHANLTWYR